VTVRLSDTHNSRYHSRMPTSLTLAAPSLHRFNTSIITMASFCNSSARWR